MNQWVNWEETAHIKKLKTIIWKKLHNSKYNVVAIWWECEDKNVNLFYPKMSINIWKEISPKEIRDIVITMVEANKVHMKNNNKLVAKKKKKKVPNSLGSQYSSELYKIIPYNTQL